jgi:hypothetical protein
MSLSTFFERDLDKIITEISLFENENDIWKIKEGILNSAGNLALHIIGNLNHFIGTTLGNTGYVRNRDEEFSLKDIPRETLIADINDLKETVKNTLSKLSSSDLQNDFPIKIRNEVFSTQNMLVFLLAHLNYHLGQLNYLRRMM